MGYMEIPLFDRAVETQLYPQNTVTWWGNLHLPTKACKFWFILPAMVYRAIEQAISTLYAMALLQVYQAKALKELHRGSSDPEVLAQ